MSSIVKAAVVATSIIHRAGLSTFLQGQPNLQLIASSAGIENIFESVPSNESLLLFLCAFDDVSTLIELAAQAHKINEQCTIVLVTDRKFATSLLTDLNELLNINVRGLLFDIADEGKLLACLQACSSGAMFIESVGSVLPDLSKLCWLKNKIIADYLSERELDVVQQVALGMSNREIAESLNITMSTVKNHLQNIMRKCGVTNRTALINLALRAKSSFPDKTTTIS